MLIFLHDSLTTNINLLTEKDIFHLDDILLLHSKFIHYVAATRRTANLLSKGLLGRLSVRAQEALNTISTQSADSVSLIKTSRFYVEIRERELAGLTVEEGISSVKWICNLSYAAVNLSQPSKIIGENLTDVKIFRSAGKHYAIANKINPKMQYFIAEMTGGSGNAADVLTERISDGISPVLCVIDSDRLSPDNSGSACVGKCKKVITRMRGISYFYPLPERELENVIPLRFLHEAILKLDLSEDRDSILERASILSDLYTESRAVYKYVDLKKGTCRSWINEKGLSKFYKKEKIRYKCNCKIDCEGFISPPIFDDLLIKTSEYFDECSEKNLREIPMESTNQSWIDLGAIVFSMALSNQIRTT